MPNSIPKRQMSVAGSFYPASCEELQRTIQNFAIDTTDKKQRVRALVAPHAGYIYSGQSAALAYSRVATTKVKRVVVIGPSHRVAFEGASVGLHESCITPCAELPVDLDCAHALIDNYDCLGFNPAAHSEHSTETQFPLIHHYLGIVPVVEIVYAYTTAGELLPIVEHLLADDETLLVISTDLSHFHQRDEAEQIDAICCRALRKLQSSLLANGGEACGMLGLTALIDAAARLMLHSELTDYRTSFDASGDAQRVVGYLSGLILD